MTPEEIDKLIATYEKRLRINRIALDGARDTLAKTEAVARYWLDECQITQRKILEIERMKDDDANT